MNSNLTESQVRALRALVYGECSDGNWSAVKDNWMRYDSQEWLAAKELQPLRLSYPATQ